MTKIIKLQALIRGKLLRKKYNIKSTYRAKETETYRYNYKDNNSEIRSINIGSDIINGAGLSNGGNSNRHKYNQRPINFSSYKANSSDPKEKTNVILQNIVRKNYIFNITYIFNK